jgi:hypothetical protein
LLVENIIKWQMVKAHFEILELSSPNLKPNMLSQAMFHGRAVEFRALPAVTLMVSPGDPLSATHPIFVF